MSDSHGRSQDFSKGGSHWLIQRVLIRLSPEYCKLFAYKKAYKGGVTGTPGPPPPGYAYGHCVEGNNCRCTSGKKVRPAKERVHRELSHELRGSDTKAGKNTRQRRSRRKSCHGIQELKKYLSWRGSWQWFIPRNRSSVHLERCFTLMQARIQGRWNGWIFLSSILFFFFSYHLNQALVLIHYYKNSPTFQNPGSAPVMASISITLGLLRICCPILFEASKF